MPELGRTASGVGRLGVDQQLRRSAHRGRQLRRVSGYTKQLNAALSTSTPGVEIQAAFAGLYGQGIGGQFNLADPDEIFLTARIRRQLSELLKTTSPPTTASPLRSAPPA